MSIDYNRMMSAYNRMTDQINSMMKSIGGYSAGGVQMQKLFELQMNMNQLSMFGQTVTNVIQGVQEVAMGVARNAKGA
jgi:hypothetical protein